MTIEGGLGIEVERPQRGRIHPELIARAKTIPAGEITARIRPQIHSQAVTGPLGVILESSRRCRR